MKKQLLILFMLASFSSSFAQGLTKEDYLRRSKNQKKTAWILCGTGATLILTSLIVYPNNYSFLGFNSAAEQRQANSAGVLFTAGGICVLGSIPFFILSGGNRKKAAALSFRLNRFQAPGTGFGWSVFRPSLGLQIGL